MSTELMYASSARRPRISAGTRWRAFVAAVLGAGVWMAACGWLALKYGGGVSDGAGWALFIVVWLSASVIAGVISMLIVESAIQAAITAIIVPPLLYAAAVVFVLFVVWVQCRDGGCFS